MEFLVIHLIHRQCKHLQFWSSNCFFLTAKGPLSNFIPILYSERFILCKKVVYNDLSLELNTSFDFQLRTLSVRLPS